MAGKIRPSLIFLNEKNAEIIIKDRENNEKIRAIIDINDVDKVKKYRWHITSKNYVRTTINGKIIYLHRFLLNIKNKKQIDHINQNPLDNRRKNLRILNLCGNRLNSKINSNNKSGFRGVSKRPNGKWQSSILVNNQVKYLAETYDKNLAIQRRKEAEEKYYPGVIFDA